MRRTILLLFLFISVAVKATTYYVATTGRDTNPGTINSPFATWSKLGSVLMAGDIAYIRGGTYRTTYSASANQHVGWYSLDGTASNNIQILAYPGENPILNLDNIIPTSSYCFAFFMQNCSYVHVKGLRITGLPQASSGNSITGMYIVNSPNCVFEQCEVDHIGGYGISLGDGSDDILFKNCDVHHCADPYTLYENANGFNITGRSTATDIIFDGCRSWKNSDDGWDFFQTDGKFTLNNCWSFFNGFDDQFNKLGDGNAFKLGPNATDKSTSVLRIITNCIAAKNEVNGFDQNTVDYSCIMHLYNNAAYDNGYVGFKFNYLNGISNEFNNNLSFGNDYAESSLGKGIVQSNNNWNGGVTVSSADFSSTDWSELEGPRKADGSLPDIEFLHLVTGSDLIDAGIDVGLPYNGTNPDIGAFETGGPVAPAKPVYVSSAIENTAPGSLTMNYSLSLANIIPSVSSFLVKVNSVSRSVSGITISGTKVTLALSSAVVYGDVITISYTKPSANPLQTSNEGEAESISSQPVANRVNSPSPLYISAVIENAAPSILELTFDQTLANIVPSPSSFSVRVNTISRTVNAVIISGTKVKLTLATPVVYGNIVTVAYNKPTASPLQSPSSGQVASFTAQNVTNKVAALLPVYLSSSIENATPSLLEITFNLNLANIVPVASSFVVQVNSVPRTVSGLIISGSKVTLTLSSPVVYGNTVTIAYNKPATNPLQTTSSGQVATFSGQTVTNKVAASGPAYVRSTIENSSPSVLELTFNKDLANILPAAGSFVVMVNSSARTVNSVLISGAKVKLTLAAAVGYGDIITVAYNKPSVNPLQSGTAGQVVSFTAQQVTNNCLDNKGISGKIQMLVYPNPVHNYINILIDDANHSANIVKIFDLKGKLVIEELIEQGTSKLQFPVNLNTGMYIITLQLGNIVLYTQKLIINS
jgi:uncharacterized repeat protein (TIGR02059 family)